MKPQNFCDCGGPWRLRRLGFFVNHLKLVNSIPGLIHPRGKSKTEILFLSKALFMYSNPETFDDADLLDVTVDEQSYRPIVDHFQYLGSFISRGVTDDRDVDARLLKAGNAFRSIRKSLFGSQYVHDSVNLFTSHSYYLVYSTVPNVSV